MGNRFHLRLMSSRLEVGIISLATLASVIVVGSPAQAYDNDRVDRRFAVVDTDNCVRVDGGLSVIAYSTYCQLNDSVDNSYFEKDAGAMATKFELHDSSGMLAKVEFHPLGEKLWVYDTRNDGDGVQVWLDVLCEGTGLGPFSVQGTDNTIDYAVFDLNIAEGCDINVDILDSPEDLLFKTQAVA